MFLESPSRQNPRQAGDLPIDGLAVGLGPRLGTCALVVRGSRRYKVLKYATGRRLCTNTNTRSRHQPPDVQPWHDRSQFKSIVTVPLC